MFLWNCPPIPLTNSNTSHIGQNVGVGEKWVGRSPKRVCHMAGWPPPPPSPSRSGQNEVNPVFWLATRVVMAGCSRDFSLGPTSKDVVLAALLRQTANVRYSGLQFLSLESIICLGWNWHKTTKLTVINSKWQVKRILGHVVQIEIAVCRLPKW